MKKLVLFVYLSSLLLASDVSNVAYIMGKKTYRFSGDDAKISQLEEKMLKSTFDSLNEVFNAINKKRIGLSPQEIVLTKDPFIKKSVPVLTVDKDDESDNKNAKASITYVLLGILNNKANINGSWYGVGDKINNYKLLSVDYDNVVLDNVDSKLKLTLEKGSKNVIIQSR